MKKIIFVLIFLSFPPLILSACTSQPRETSYRTISINNQELAIEIADSPAKRSQGLSGRDSLPAEHGMLFVFEDYGQPGFWMKDMRFPLDIIWIRDNMVIDITENIQVPGNNQLESYYPSGAVNYVLEVNAGWVNQHHIKIGDEIQL